jgi:hypothetical protein
MLVVAFQNPVKALIERIVLSPKGRLTRDIATWGIDLGDAADKLQSECANIILATFVIPYLNRVYERKLFLLSCFKSPNIGDVTRKAHFGSRRETGYPTVWWKSSPKWHSVIQQTDAPTFAPLTRGRIMRPNGPPAREGNLVANHGRRIRLSAGHSRSSACTTSASQQCHGSSPSTGRPTHSL